MATRAPNDRFAALGEAALAIERGLDLAETLQAVAEAARAVTGARYTALGVLGPDRRIARFITAGLTPEETERIGAYPTGRGLLGVLIDLGRPVRVPDLGADPRSVGFPPNHPPMRSFLGVPVQARGEVFGNLYLTEAPGGEFSDDDEAVVQLLAVKAGIAIENARLYEEARRQTADARRAAQARASVNAVAASILRERDVLRVMTLLAEEAQALTAARTVAIGVPDEISETIRFPVAVGADRDRLRACEVPFEGSLAGTVLMAGESLRVDDAAHTSAVDEGAAPELEAGAIVAVPMNAGDETVAVMLAIDRHDAEPFSAEDQDLLEGLATLGAVALQTARAFGRERARSEAIGRLRQAEAEAEAQRMGMRRVVDAQESERRRIAQDLHDRTAGSLAAIQLSLKRLEREQDVDRLHAAAADLRDEVARTIDDLRDLIVDLRPRVLDDFGLSPALERLCDSLGRRSGLTVDVAAGPGVDEVRGELASAAYRIVQEALTNVVRHARAASVRVTSAVEHGQLLVAIEDDGVGVRDGHHDGYGLEGMRQRAALVDGRLQITVPTEGGTRVTFEAPL